MLPKKNSATLSPPHLRDFLKRLRARVQPTRLRYFAVGEYGDRSDRPHYHMALFGLSGCSFGTTRLRKLQTSKSCCPSCDLVQSCWSHGSIFIGELNSVTAGYISGYVVKKMTSTDDLRLDGRHPEFARMSLRPGIGADMMDEVASVLLQYDEDLQDVPTALRHGSSMMPLGRYLCQQLRKRMGRDPKSPQVVTEARALEMRPLRDFAFLNSLSFKEVVKEFYAPETERLERVFKIRERSKQL